MYVESQISYIDRRKMARGTPDNLYLEENVVALVYNTKLPDLIGIMEGVRASDLDRFDSEVMRLEESIIDVTVFKEKIGIWEKKKHQI